MNEWRFIPNARALGTTNLWACGEYGGFHHRLNRLLFHCQFLVEDGDWTDGGLSHTMEQDHWACETRDE